jgi:BolA family transcriptional regulator, general stress-responsive regulator
MSTPANDVKTALEERLAALSPTRLEIRDDSAKHAGHAGAASGARHFSVTIVSEHFLGLTRVARHRAILERVGDLIPYPVHALAIDAHAPDEIRTDERMKQ